MQIKNVLLDLDNTILDFDTAERAAITKTLRAWHRADRHDSEAILGDQYDFLGKA